MSNTTWQQRIRLSNNALGLFCAFFLVLSALIFIWVLFPNFDLGDFAFQFLKLPVGIPKWIMEAWIFCTTISFVHYLTIILDGFFKKWTLAIVLDEAAEKRNQEKRWVEYVLTALGFVAGFIGSIALYANPFTLIRFIALGSGFGSRWGRVGNLWGNISRWFWIRNYELALIGTTVGMIVLDIFVPDLFTTIDGIIFFGGVLAAGGDLGRIFDVLSEMFFKTEKTIIDLARRCWGIQPQTNEAQDRKKAFEAYAVGDNEKAGTLIGFIVTSFVGAFLFSEGCVPVNMPFLAASVLPVPLQAILYTLFIVGIFNGPPKRIFGRVIDAFADNKLSCEFCRVQISSRPIMVERLELRPVNPQPGPPPAHAQNRALQNGHVP